MKFFCAVSVLLVLLKVIWPQGAVETGIQDGLSQEEEFHISAS